ncbi:MAG: heme-binding domain-containing protein [Acidimicrobiales bacterium]
MNTESQRADRLQAFLAANRWPAVASLILVAIAILGGLIIGLAPGLIAALAIGIWAAAIGFLALRRRTRDHPVGPVTVAAHFSLVAAVALIAIQFFPYGRDHTNPPVTGEPAWSSPRTRELMVNACYGCHSNEVQWPWYSNIAPLSWAISDHVEEGRDAINYSEFPTGADEADETIEVILEREMPPAYYTIFGLHPEANLSEAEIAELVAGLRSTPGLSEGGDDDSEHGGGD